MFIAESTSEKVLKIKLRFDTIMAMSLACSFSPTLYSESASRLIQTTSP